MYNHLFPNHYLMNALFNKFCTLFVFFLSTLAYSQTSVFDETTKEIREYLSSPGKELRPDLLKKIKDYKQYYLTKNSSDTLLQILSYEIKYVGHYGQAEEIYELSKAYFAYDSTSYNPYNSWAIVHYVGTLQYLQKKDELLEFIQYAYTFYDKTDDSFYLLNIFAKAYFELKEYKNAIETYSLICELSADDDDNIKAGMENNIGLSYGYLKDTVNAVKHYKLAKKYWLKVNDDDSVHPDYYEYMLKIIDANIAKLKNKNNDCELLTLYQNILQHKHLQKSLDTYFPYSIYLNLIKYSYTCGKHELTKTYLKTLSQSNSIKYFTDQQYQVYNIVNTLLSIDLSRHSTLASRNKNYNTLLTFSNVPTDSSTISFSDLIAKNLNIANQLLESEHNMVVKEQHQNELEKVIFGLSFLIITVLAYFIYRIYRNNKMINHQKLTLDKTLIEREVLIKEIHHRVKNNLQMISSFALIEQTKSTKVFNVHNFRNQIKSVAIVYNLLSEHDTLTDLNFETYIIKLGDEILNTLKIDYIQIYTKITNVNFNLDETIYLGLIINELITNTIKHGAIKHNGEIHINIQNLTNSTLTLIYRDNGIGISNSKTSSKSTGKRLIELLSNKIHATSTIYNDNGFVLELTINQTNNE